MKNVDETILVQYANSPRLCAIIRQFNAAIDPTTLIETFYNNVWNIRTATGWGLDVWGRIVGVQRVLKVPTDAWFGFNEANDGTGTITPFNDRQFYLGGVNVGEAYITNNYRLTDEAYRKLILAKAAANITNSSIASINAILMSIFGDNGKIWVEDHNNLTITINYNFTPSPVDAVIIENSGVLPRPSGVYVSYKQVAQ